jgi:ubiquinone/menaquinone biosynthesis C-methylase UbiE
MPDRVDVARHYAHGGLIEAIRAGILAAGKTIESVTIDDLAPVDEFHIGGRKATEEFLDQLGLSENSHVLDVGCGLGGAARFAARRYGSRITGIDLTSEYVDTGNALCAWVGLGDRVSLSRGSAVDLPFADGSFDGAYMLHVGMNIDDKHRLAQHVARVLRPGSIFGIYDVMRIGPGDLTYPVPWAAEPSLSALEEPARYKAALQSSGFAIVAERNRKDFALAFFAELRARTMAAGGPPPLGLQILMGNTAAQKIENMIAATSADRIAPVELIARKS